MDNENFSKELLEQANALLQDNARMHLDAAKTHLAMAELHKTVAERDGQLELANLGRYELNLEVHDLTQQNAVLSRGLNGGLSKAASSLKTMAMEKKRALSIGKQKPTN
ncbi:hypothetical protein [Paenibacillus radicis (ex Xue et al. 2023)]|uniref:Uncharacterized protein n=1 Tax=Paenibacillus radicis (ex Xue et al. 2023) TaxID=2972489 RepID=A0ABT1YDB3_9BACL|nr:hypothetical protein [Paenibacillus radicis (ex Xue et al. 2023)]MCR8631178.1 hypothetical protein [Paenibacillus radicis (ex Xue et al. 2023)]